MFGESLEVERYHRSDIGDIVMEQRCHLVLSLEDSSILWDEPLIE